MITAQELLDNGYRCFGNYPLREGKLYQKAIWKDDRKLFFINFLEVDFTPFHHTMPKGSPLYAYQSDVQFKLDEDDCFEVHCHFKSVAQTEEFMYSVFTKFNCRGEDDD